MQGQKKLTVARDSRLETLVKTSELHEAALGLNLPESRNSLEQMKPRRRASARFDFQMGARTQQEEAKEEGEGGEEALDGRGETPGRRWREVLNHPSVSAEWGLEK